MFIEELMEACLGAEENGRLSAKLKRRQEEALSRINQPIFFRDLVVTSPHQYSFGESKEHTNNYPQHASERLLSHVSLLMQLANLDHRTNYCEQNNEGQFVPKNGKKNHITRLSTNEFSLYTRYPLSINEFQQMVSSINLMSENLLPNVHLLLSSFSVQMQQGKILNLCLYVEGGNPPKIHSLAKNTASEIDVEYKGKTLFSQSRRATEPSFESEGVISEDNTLIPTGSVFEVETLGGARYTQAVDICLDHIFGHSKKILNRRLFDVSAPDEIFPNQIEHCVTSNSVELQPKQSISTHVLHADSIERMHQAHQAKLGQHVLKREVLQQIIPSGYPNMSIEETKSGYTINNPAFGSHYFVEVLEERPAATYKGPIANEVHAHNQSVLKRQCLSAQKGNIQDIDKFVKDTKNALCNNIIPLEIKLLKLCKPGFWQWLFNTVEYRQKLEAKRVISEAFETIYELMKKHGHQTILNFNAWKKDLEFKLNRIGTPTTPNPFKTKLMNAIQQTKNELERAIGLEFEQPSTKTQKNR